MQSIGIDSRQLIDRLPASFNPARQQNAEFIERNHRRHHGEWCDNRIRDGSDDFGKGKQDKVGDPSLFAQNIRSQQAQLDKDNQHGRQLKGHAANQEKECIQKCAATPFDPPQAGQTVVCAPCALASRSGGAMV